MNEMDLLASLDQLTEHESDVKKNAVISSGSLLLGAEFANLTADVVQVVVEDKPTDTKSEAMDTVSATDILAELLEKMTGVTGAVAAPADQAGVARVAADHEGETGIPAVAATPVINANAAVATVARTGEARVVADPVDQTGVMHDVATSVDQTDEYPEDKVQIVSAGRDKTRIMPTKTVMVPHTQVKNAGSGPPTPLNIATNKTQKYKNQQPEKAPSGGEGILLRHAEGSSDFPDVAHLSAKMPIEVSDKGHVSWVFAMDSSGPAASPQNDTDVGAKKSRSETLNLFPSEPLIKADIVEHMIKPVTAPFVESRIIGQELAVQDAPRLPVDARPVQINPPALFRQITDTVVTMRDEMVEIRLSPEELGRVRMVLTGQDRAPHLTIWVDRPEILEQMRRQGDTLLQQLREQGMSANLDFRDGRQSRDGTEQKLALIQRQSDPENTPLATSLTNVPELSRITPVFTGRQGINIRV